MITAGLKSVKERDIFVVGQFEVKKEVDRINRIDTIKEESS